MRSTASPGRNLAGSPILSKLAGHTPGACSHRTRPLTLYVPPVVPPPAVTVQVPPPVTLSDGPPPPAVVTKVPVPVNVIWSPMLLSADAWPPGFTVAPGVVRR